RVRAFHSQSDQAGVRTGCNHKIIFKLALCPVVDQVNSRIYGVLLDSAICRNVGVPGLRSVADKVVALPRQLLDCKKRARGICTCKLHAQGHWMDRPTARWRM